MQCMLHHGAGCTLALSHVVSRMIKCSIAPWPQAGRCATTRSNASSATGRRSLALRQQMPGAARLRAPTRPRPPARRSFALRQQMPGAALLLRASSTRPWPPARRSLALRHQAPGAALLRALQILCTTLTESSFSHRLTNSFFNNHMFDVSDIAYVLVHMSLNPCQRIQQHRKHELAS